MVIWPGRLKTIARKRVVPYFAYLPSLGLIKKPDSFREEGVSVMMRVKDEVDWIELSILSIKDFADEVVIVDNGSTDGTTEIIQRMADKCDKIRWVSFLKENYVEVSNVALMNTHFRWILTWDGDFVARTSGDMDIMRLRERIMNLDKNKYYLIWLPVVTLYGDLFHQLRRYPLNIEGRLHTYSPELKYVQSSVQRRFEKLVGSRLWGERVPLYYKRIFFKEIYAFHCHIKPAKRMLFRGFWTPWRELGDYRRFPTLIDYVRYRIRKDWGTNDLEIAAALNIKELCKRLVPYDGKRFGDYPELLRERLENPRYKLVYKNGEIIGRNDVLG